MTHILLHVGQCLSTSTAWGIHFGHGGMHSHARYHIVRHNDVSYQPVYLCGTAPKLKPLIIRLFPYIHSIVTLIRFGNPHAIVQVKDLELPERRRQRSLQLHRVAFEETRWTSGTAARTRYFQSRNLQVYRFGTLRARSPFAADLLQNSARFFAAEGKR